VKLYGFLPSEPAPERTGAVGGASLNVVAEAGYASQEPFAFQDAQSLAACLPRVSVLLAEAGDRWCRQARLQSSVADLLADQRCQTPVSPWVCVMQVSCGHRLLSSHTRGFPRIVAYGRLSQVRLAAASGYRGGKQDEGHSPGCGSASDASIRPTRMLL